jgi:hypothetical protein
MTWDCVKLMSLCQSSMIPGPREAEGHLCVQVQGRREARLSNVGEERPSGPEQSRCHCGSFHLARNLPSSRVGKRLLGHTKYSASGRQLSSSGQTASFQGKQPEARPLGARLDQGGHRIAAKQDRGQARCQLWAGARAPRKKKSRGPEH